VNQARSTRQAALIGIAIVAAVFGIAATVMQIRGHFRHSPIHTIQITGVVLRNNKKPDQQSPIANVDILASGGLFEQEVKSDTAGRFQLNVRVGFLRQEPILLRFEHAGYKPVEVNQVSDNRLYVVRMDPIAAEPEPAGGEKDLPVKDVRIRYTLRSETRMNIGNIAKQLVVTNIGNVPCAGSRTCSPDGKWRASAGTLTLDAGDGNLFENVRVTCVAGPCPFTAVTSEAPLRPSAVIRVSALNWSDTAVFLIEAELTRTAVTDSMRRIYPTIIGRTMTFTLPAGASGPTVEVTLNGEEIMFPLGPKRILSWATCGVEIGRDQNSTYRCELKSGYTFPQ
jgi:hypothetical protein